MYINKEVPEKETHNIIGGEIRLHLFLQVRLRKKWEEVFF